MMDLVGYVGDMSATCRMTRDVSPVSRQTTRCHNIALGGVLFLVSAPVGEIYVHILEVRTPSSYLRMFFTGFISVELPVALFAIWMYVGKLRAGRADDIADFSCVFARFVSCECHDSCRRYKMS